MRSGIGLVGQIHLFRDPERFLCTLDEFRVVPDLNARKVAVVDPHSAWHTVRGRPEPWQVHLGEPVDDRPLDKATRTRGRRKPIGD